MNTEEAAREPDIDVPGQNEDVCAITLHVGRRESADQSTRLSWICGDGERTYTIWKGPFLMDIVKAPLESSSAHSNDDTVNSKLCKVSEGKFQRQQVGRSEIRVTAGVHLGLMNGYC